MLGKVKRFNKLKGFGFITTDEGEDAFFHYSEIVMEGYKTVDEGARVEFDLVEGERGLQAHNIRKVEDETPGLVEWLILIFIYLYINVIILNVLEVYHGTIW